MVAEDLWQGLLIVVHTIGLYHKRVTSFVARRSSEIVVTYSCFLAAGWVWL